MSIKASYFTRAGLSNALTRCFYRDAPVIHTLRETIVGKSSDEMRANEIVKAVFDARPNVSEIPFITLESEFRARGEHELINNIIESLDPGEVR